MRPLIKIVSNERGIALITSLLITLLLTMVVIALSYRIGLFSMGTRDKVVKSQSLYAAEIGLNQARYVLLGKDCVPPNWSACLPGVNKNTFTNMSGSINSIFNTSLPTYTVAGEQYSFSASSLTHGSGDKYNYKVYAKVTNIPKVINIMAVSSRPNNEQAQTVIDAGIIFTMPLDQEYKQQGGGPARGGVRGDTTGTTAASGNIRASL